MALAAALLACAAARAQEAISTAAGGPPAGAPAAPPSAPITLPDRLDRGDEGPPRMGPCGPTSEDADAKPHGEVWAAAGTRGYRDIGGVLCQPLGKTSALTIAVDRAQIGERR